MGIGHTSDTIRALTHILYDRISLLQVLRHLVDGWKYLHTDTIFTAGREYQWWLYIPGTAGGDHMYSYVAHKHTFWTAFQKSMIKGKFEVNHKIGPVVNLVQLTERPEWDIRTQWISSRSDTCWLKFQPGIIKYDLGPTLSLLARRVIDNKNGCYIPDRHCDKQRHFHATHARTFQPVSAGSTTSTNTFCMLWKLLWMTWTIYIFLYEPVWSGPGNI